MDYSKWDHIDTDSSGDEGNVSNVRDVARGGTDLRDVVGHNGEMQVRDKISHRGGVDDVAAFMNRKTVIGPDGRDSDFPDFFYTDPEKFVPGPKEHDEWTGRSIRSSWGIPHDMDPDRSFRKMKTQFRYMNRDDPAVAFVKGLAAKKLRLVRAARETPAVQAHMRSDYVLTVTIPMKGFSVWRKIKVCGGVTLRLLVDKVLEPVFGWKRDYHAYYFCDQVDGACFACPEHGGIDRMHMSMHCIHAIDDKDAFVADLLHAPGDELVWYHDCGDLFCHVISVDEIRSPEASDRKCVVLEGANAGLPEDFMGWGEDYPRLVEMFRTNKRKGNYRELMGKVTSAINIGDARGWSPFNFSVDQCNAQLSMALASPNSSMKGTQFQYNTHDGTRTQIGPIPKATRDRGFQTLCAACGNPHELKACGRCELTHYCSRECQRAQWPTHKHSCVAK